MKLCCSKSDFHKRYIKFTASDTNGTFNGSDKTSLTASKYELHLKREIESQVEEYEHKNIMKYKKEQHENKN